MSEALSDNQHKETYIEFEDKQLALQKKEGGKAAKRIVKEEKKILLTERKKNGQRTRQK